MIYKPGHLLRVDGRDFVLVEASGDGLVARPLHPAGSPAPSCWYARPYSVATFPLALLLERQATLEVVDDLETDLAVWAEQGVSDDELVELLQLRAGVKTRTAPAPPTPGPTAEALRSLFADGPLAVDHTTEAPPCEGMARPTTRPDRSDSVVDELRRLTREVRGLRREPAAYGLDAREIRAGDRDVVADPRRGDVWRTAEASAWLYIVVAVDALVVVLAASGPYRGNPPIAVPRRELPIALLGAEFRGAAATVVPDPVRGDRMHALELPPLVLARLIPNKAHESTAADRHVLRLPDGTGHVFPACDLDGKPRPWSDIAAKAAWVEVEAAVDHADDRVRRLIELRPTGLRGGAVDIRRDEVEALTREIVGGAA